MRRIHQVFVSSTYTDLVEERDMVFRALQKLGCLPVGMEQFSAGGALPWDVIEPLINDSDYYCLIIGNRYGSMLDDGISYTRREYEYAKSLKKWTMPHLHRDPTSLPMSKGDQDEAKWKKLQEFIAKVKNENTVDTWETKHELTTNVVTALTSAFAQHPQPGWIRGEVLHQNQRVTKQAARILEDALKSPRAAPVPPDNKESRSELARLRQDLRDRIRQILVDEARSLSAAPDRPTADELQALSDDEMLRALDPSHPLTLVWMQLTPLHNPKEPLPRWEEARKKSELARYALLVDEYVRSNESKPQ